VKALRRERELVAAFGQLVLPEVGDGPRRGELGLEVGQVLTLVRSETGDVDEADDVAGRAGRGDDRTAVGMTSQQDRAADLINDGLEVLRRRRLDRAAGSAERRPSCLGREARHTDRETRMRQRRRRGREQLWDQPFLITSLRSDEWSAHHR